MVSEPYIKHPLIVEDEKNDEDDGGDDKPEDEEIKVKASKGGDDKRMLTMKDYGDYMKPFLNFYDAKSLEPPMTPKMIIKLETKIFKEVEIAVK